MMRAIKAFSFLWVGLTVLLAGCVTVQMPQYLKDKNPYEREFYVNYDKALKATIQALERSGWTVAKQSNPMVFESTSVNEIEEQPKQVILFTNIRQNAMLFGTCYRTLNVLVKENKEKTDVEIRYLGIFSTIFKNFEDYKNDGLVNRIFEQIDKIVKTL